MAEIALPRIVARRRVDLRVVVGVFLMLLAVFGGATVIRHANTRTDVLVVARPVSPGQVLTDGDLRVAEVGLDPSMQGVVPASDQAAVTGRVAGQPLRPGELLSRYDLASSSIPRGFVAMSIPAKPEQAVGGELRSGDHVAVIATYGAGQPQARTATILPDVVVHSVGPESDFGGGNAALVITLLVPQGSEEQLAAARAGANLDVVLLPAGAGS